MMVSCSVQKGQTKARVIKLPLVCVFAQTVTNTSLMNSPPTTNFLGEWRGVSGD